ncbi:MarR family winged helix-turn-helix transcriptional regulator [Adhaeribacter radiodurans]|uniref:Winged helix-turn-helix transcriptional regulator n=1 Tax=Adhaeribacter radiodurans TaxID=2745197 RepID=A0A7L7L6V7_9BACT|nr:MarR family winged helix-turn-helix transcriptional regulator [Adhaeribacter radiodurans]QMU28079.1 winged helix-turn-helix transcriptional regulator [Adhaeribacter radiodurans]
MSATNYQLLQELLPWLARYEQEQGPGQVNLPEFQKWLGERLIQEKETMPASTPAEALDGEIARYLTSLNRYAKYYTKKALQHTEFVSLDDFGYLMHLLDGGSMIKSTLIHKNIQDIPSGTEIIKRLIRQDWVNETRHEADKRKVYLTINDRGKAALFASLGQLRKVSRIVSGNLDLLEKQQLLRILKKLENFHQHQFVPNKDKSIDEFL